MIEVKIENLNELKRALAKAPQITVSELGNAVKKYIDTIYVPIKVEAPRRTGNLGRHINRYFSFLAGIIKSEAPYSSAVHDGSVPHVIVPKNKPFLAWKKDGKWIYCKRPVFHPGYKGYPWMQNVVDRMEGIKNFIFDNALKNIVKKLSE